MSIDSHIAQIMSHPAARLNNFGQPIGPKMEHWIAPLFPPKININGTYCFLEPLDPERHSAQLWEAFKESDAREWTYLLAEFPGAESALKALYMDTCKREDIVPYVVMHGATKKAVGTMTYMNISTKDGGLEIGGINLSRQLKKTRLSTEAIYLMIHQAFELGYRRVVWKCDALNVASRNAALRYGFTFEGIFRNHMIIKGRSRDTAWFSMIDSDWKATQTAFTSWLDDSNFDPNGDQIRRLGDFMPPRINLL